jgi:hypothetical protein
MENIESKQWILDFKKRWIFFSLSQLILFSISIAILISVLAHHFFRFQFQFTFPILAIAVFAISYLFSNKNKELTAIVKYLNQRFPELEESSQLILQPKSSLSSLQKLQAQKVSAVLVNMPQPNETAHKLKSGFLVLIAAIAISFLISYLPKNVKFIGHLSSVSAKAKTVIDKILPEIKRVDVEVKSPSYTNLGTINQNQFTLKVATGSKVSWEMESNIAVQKMQLIFNDQEVLDLKSINSRGTKWRVSKTITKAGFYQVNLAGKRSDLYQIEVIADLPVNIKILKPEQQTVIDFGQPQKVDLQVQLSDDYGIRNAFISATVSSGKGEGVSFKEQKIAFNQTVSGKKMQLEQSLNLRNLGMKPGDELYFFIKAMDNHGQESRSDIYLVAIQDTSELMSLTGLASGVNLVPEYFRSQRQIIIDTEKLLKEKSSISEDDYKNRSNNLGIDQKMLRLRYGKFLGEESETYGSQGKIEEHSANDGHEHSKQENAKFGDVQAIMDDYAHKHDNAEDASFFEPQLKAKLKATLSEMWNSELRLRTFKTQDALPFEYKALRLLKDLQQSSRAYVAKTTVKTTLLKAEKRLTGELDKIISPKKQADFEPKDNNNEKLKNAIVVLEKHKENKVLAYADAKVLQDAQGTLIEAASKNPSTFLPALKLIRKSNQLTNKEINLIENALQKLMIIAPFLPNAQENSSSGSLGKSYFKNLKNANK